MLALAACGSDDSASTSASTAGADTATSEAPKADCPVKVLVVVGLTGPAASNGQSVKTTTDLTVKKINDAGGVLGCPVEVTYKDDGSDPTKDLPLTREALSTDEYAMVNIAGYGGAIVAPYVTSNNQLTFVADGSLGSTAGGTPVFDVNPGGNTGAAKGGEAMASEGMKTAVTVVNNTPVGEAQGKAFADAFEEAGGKILARETVPSGTTNMQPVIARLKRAGADVLYVNLFGTDAGAFFKAAKAGGLDTPILGGSAVFGTNVPELVDADAYANARVVGPQVGIAPPTEGAASLISLLKDGGVKIDQQLWLYALPHDVLTIFAAAAEGAQSLETDDIVAWLEEHGEEPIEGLAQAETTGYSSETHQMAAPFAIADIAPLVDGQWAGKAE